MKKIQSTKLETAIHMIAAMVLLISGFDQISTGSLFSGSIILSFGILVLTITLFRQSIKLSPMQVKFVGYSIEAIALLITAYFFFIDNKVYLPFLYLFLSIVYFIMAAIAIMKEIKTTRNHG